MDGSPCVGGLSSTRLADNCKYVQYFNSVIGGFRQLIFSYPDWGLISAPVGGVLYLNLGRIGKIERDNYL